MKKIFAFFFLWISTAVAQESEFSITKSKEIKINYDQTNYGVYPAGNGKMTGIIYDPGRRLFFNMYNANAELIDTTSVDISGITPNPLFERVLKVGEHTYWFYSIQEKETKVYRLYAQKLDLVHGKFSGSPVILVEATKLYGIDDFTFFNKNYKRYVYCLSLSGAGDVLLVSYRRPRETANDSNSFLTYGLQVFNPSMEKLWSREYKMSYTEEFSEATAFAVDSKSNAFMVMKVYEETEREADRRRRLFHYEILGTDGKTENLTVFNMKMDAKLINALSINQDNSGNLICAGFYTTQPREGVTDGAFMTQLDLSQSSKTMEQMKFYPYDGDVKKEIEEVKAFRKAKNRKDVKNPEDSNMLIDTIHFHKDGSITICAEEFHYFFIGLNEYEANYDIIAVNFQSNGEPGWMKNISRRKEGYNHRSPPASSYSNSGSTLGRQRLEYTGPRWEALPNAIRSFLFNDELYFFYVDDDKNLSLPPGHIADRYYHPHGGKLVSAKIDKSGIVTRIQLGNKKEIDCDIDPFFIRQSGPSELVAGCGFNEAIVLKFVKK